MIQHIKKYICTVFLLLIGTLSLTTHTWASDKDFPPIPNPPKLVNDLAGFMNPVQQNLLEQKLRAYYDSTTSEIAIVTIQSIGDYDISDYTVTLYNKWKIGSKKNNNGILILAAKEQRKIWITSGYGLEGVLPDGLLGQIIREQIEPLFKQGYFYQGFNNGVDAIIAASHGEYKAASRNIKEDNYTKESITPFIVLAIILILIFVIAFNTGDNNDKGGGGGRSRSDAAFWIVSSMLANRNNGGSSGGFGGFGGGSSGGFGGFGGGSSGGGGAGGSW